MTYHPVDWGEIMKGHLSVFFAISKNKNIPPLIANCVRLLTGSFNLSICVVYLILKCSIKQFCVCTLIPSWLKNTNTLRISYQLKHSSGV